MERYWLSNTHGSTYSIEMPIDVHHLSYVAKKQLGDKVLACNHDQCVIFEITSLSSSKAMGIPHPISTTSPIVPRILFGVSQLESKTFESLYKQLIAMGADMVIPLQCDHTRFTQDRFSENKTTQHHQLLSLDKALTSGDMQVFVLGHHPENITLEKALNHTTISTQVIILVGPERGWSEAEIAYFEQNKAVAFISLGHRVFRADTAALLAMGAIHHWRQKEVQE